MDLGVTCLARATSLNEIIATQLYQRANIIEMFKLVQDLAENQLEKVRVNNRQMGREERMHDGNLDEI